MGRVGVGMGTTRLCTVLCEGFPSSGDPAFDYGASVRVIQWDVVFGYTFSSVTFEMLHSILFNGF